MPQAETRRATVAHQYDPRDEAASLSGHGLHAESKAPTGSDDASAVPAAAVKTGTAGASASARGPRSAWLSPPAPDRRPPRGPPRQRPLSATPPRPPGAGGAKITWASVAAALRAGCATVRSGAAARPGGGKGACSWHRQPIPRRNVPCASAARPSPPVGAYDERPCPLRPPPAAPSAGGGPCPRSVGPEGLQLLSALSHGRMASASCSAVWVYFLAHGWVPSQAGSPRRRAHQGFGREHARTRRRRRRRRRHP